MRRLPVLLALACSVAGAEKDAILETEQLLEELRRPLALLSQGVSQGSLPGAAARDLFLDRVEVRDLAGAPDPRGIAIGDVGVRRRAWPVSARTVVGAAGGATLWRPFLATVDRFEHFGFYSIRGAFAGVDRLAFESLVGFQGRARLHSGGLGHVGGRVRVRWVRGDAGWAIAAFRTEQLTLTETDRPLFEDVLPDAVPLAALRQLQRSKRDDGLVEWIRSMRRGEVTFDAMVPQILEAYREGTYPFEAGQICVVDLDGDGHDDFYVTGASERALFFRNRGDGTFAEIGKSIGLALDGVHGALFADFDNDGDQDAFVTLLQRGVRYLRQEEGRFVERTDHIAGERPSWILPMAVADFDRDGLLDIYLGAWAGEYVGMVGADREKAQREGKPIDRTFPGLDDRSGRELIRRLLDPAADPILARPGPPNVLLKNVGGGRFKRAADAGTLAVWFNTLAVTWSDVDRDGDADLYVTNEAGPNQLFRNCGDGTFLEISDAVTGEVGYGMGAAFGDYDNDGRPDLYVTNMYSKAGLRIAKQFGASDAITASARGNSLLHNGGERFERRGNSPVAAADFGWGGAFADFDNDGRLDIYAPAGYVTIPAEVAEIGDT